MGIFEIIFYIPAVIFLISGIPQSIKLLKTKKSEDISALTYGLTVMAIFIIIIDAILAENLSVAFSNSVSFLITSFNLFLILKYKKNENC